MKLGRCLHAPNNKTKITAIMFQVKCITHNAATCICRHLDMTMLAILERPLDNTIGAVVERQTRECFLGLRFSAVLRIKAVHARDAYMTLLGCIALFADERSPLCIFYNILVATTTIHTTWHAVWRFENEKKN